MNAIARIDNALLDALCREAAASPRRRKNHNFHRDNEQPGHRLLNAMMRDSYIPPHRHLDPNKDESIVVLRGGFALIEFDDGGAIVGITQVGAGGTAIGVDIPHGVWHSLVALADDTVFFEAKAGPYRPLSEAERAPWAPAEGSAGAAPYLDELRRACSV